MVPTPSVSPCSHYVSKNRRTRFTQGPPHTKSTPHTVHPTQGPPHTWSTVHPTQDIDILTDTQHINIHRLIFGAQQAGRNNISEMCVGLHNVYLYIQQNLNRRIDEWLFCYVPSRTITVVNINYR